MYSSPAQQGQHAPTPPSALPPVPPSGPPGYPLPPPPPGTNIPGYSMYPFGLTGPQFQNNQCGPFNGNWNYNYNLQRFSDVGQQGIVNPVTSSQPMSVIPGNSVCASQAIGQKPNIEMKMHNENVNDPKLNTHENADNMSKPEISDEIALKVSSLLNDSNIFKSALSKLQAPQGEESAKKSGSEQSIVTDDISTRQLDASTTSILEEATHENVTVRYVLQHFQ